MAGSTEDSGSDCFCMLKRRNNKTHPFEKTNSAEKPPPLPTTRTNALRETVKVILVVMIPIVALISMTTNTLITSSKIYRDSIEAQDTIELSLQVRN